MDPSHRTLSVSPATRATFSTRAVAPEPVLLITANEVDCMQGLERG